MMEADDYKRVRSIFLRAQELEPEARRRFIERETAGSEAVRNEVLSLLEFDRPEPLIGEPSVTRELGPPHAKCRAANAMAGEVLEGKYKLESLSAEGGFGYVYRAEHLLWSQPVAVKIHKDPIGEGAEREAVRDAFIKEGAYLSRISKRTTAVVRALDVGTVDGPASQVLLFTVMEWLDGETLSSAQKARGAWALEEVLERLAPIAEALTIAHELGIAHRDVKPSNIFLAKLEAGGQTAKLLDFGQAKEDRAGGFLRTDGRLRALSLPYCAPEQMIIQSENPTGPWCDVYALATVCLELLSGQDLRDLVVGGQDSTSLTPNKIGIRVPRAVEAVFAKATHSEARQRYREVGAFWSALQEASERTPRSWLSRMRGLLS